MTAITFERLLSMGAFDGLRTLRQQASINPDLSNERLVDIVRATSVDATNLDFEAAAELGKLVAEALDHSDPQMFYRACIREVVLGRHATWARALVSGRDILLKQLDRDGRQCFRAAGLCDGPDDEHTITWWDDLGGTMRMMTSLRALAQGRRAERLSLEHELARIAGLGIKREPIWVALNNNTVGYDILSYDNGPAGPVNRLVEVKSTKASPARFFVSRNEWDQATTAPSSYVFHVWELHDTPRLHEIRAEAVSAHIPSDSGGGRWTAVEVKLGAVISRE